MKTFINKLYIFTFFHKESKSLLLYIKYKTSIKIFIMYIYEIFFNKLLLLFFFILLYHILLYLSKNINKNKKYKKLYYILLFYYFIIFLYIFYIYKLKTKLPFLKKILSFHYKL
jgi:hypothetical protein